MTTITLSSNPSIAAWETAIDTTSVESNLSGVVLKGRNAAAYLFGQAIANYSGNATTVSIRRSDAVFEFPPESGNLASLNEIADALRYKYGVDPLIEFSGRYGVPNYSVADLNALLTDLNRDFSGKFTLQTIELSPMALGDYAIDTRPLQASLEDLIDADGRASLLALAQALQDSLSNDSALRDEVARGDVGVNDAVFNGQSLRDLLDTARQTLGKALDTLMPDAFYAGRFSLATLNTLVAAALEANPDEGASLAAFASTATPTSYQAARTDWLADVRRGLRAAYAQISGFDTTDQSADERTAILSLADALAAYANSDVGISRLSVLGSLDPDAEEFLLDGQRLSFNGLVDTLELQAYVALVLPNLSQGLTLRDVNKLLATARDIDPASAEQWPAVDQAIRATGDDGRTYTGAQALVQRLATALNQWLSQTRATADDASLVPLDRDAAVLPDPLATEGSDARMSINQWTSLCLQALGTDPFEGLNDWYRADILSLRDALYAELPSAQLPIEAAPQPLDQASVVAFINRLVADAPLTGQSFLTTDALFLDEQDQAVSLNGVLASMEAGARAPILSVLASLGVVDGNQVSLAGLRQLVDWSLDNLDGITADPDAFVPDAPTGPLLSLADYKLQAGDAQASHAILEDLIDRMQAYAADDTVDWEVFSNHVQSQLGQAPAAVDGTALQAITVQSLPSLEDFRAWVDGVAQHALGVVEQYDRSVEAIYVSLGSSDLQAASRTALEQVLATVQDRRDRFEEARGVLASVATSATDRASLWEELGKVAIDSVALSLLSQIPVAEDDVLQMLRRFDVPAEATATYRTALADTAPEVFDLQAAQAVSVPVVTPVSWQDSMGDTLSVMTQLRSRMAVLESEDAWGYDISFLRARAGWNPSTAQSDLAAVARIQVWLDDVTTYGGMLDQLLAAQSDPSQFGALLEQFKQERGTTDLLGDMGYYSLPQTFGGIPWWQATGIPFRSASGDYSYLDIELWNSELDYSAFLLPPGERVAALPSISDTTVTDAVALNQQAQRALAATDAGAQSLVDGTSPLGAVDFEDIAADIDAGMVRTLDTLSSSISQLQALQGAEQYLVDAGQSFTLFDAVESRAMADRLAALTEQRASLNAARTALAGLMTLGARPASADFSAVLALLRATLFSDSDGTEDVMAKICSFALTSDQLDGGNITLELHAQTFDPGAWRAAADFSGRSYKIPDLNPHAPWAEDGALSDFRTWVDDVAAQAQLVVAQYDSTLAAIDASLTLVDLQSTPSSALGQAWLSVKGRQDRFVEALVVMQSLADSANDRETLWTGLNALASDPVAVSLLSQIPDAADDLLQMLRRFDVPTGAMATYRTDLLDTAPEVLDLEAAQAEPVPEPVLWSDGMEKTLEDMSVLRSRMGALAYVWAYDLQQMNTRPSFDPGNAPIYNDAAAKIQFWLDDVTAYGSMLDQLLAFQSDPEQFSALLEQFKLVRGTTDLLDSMGYYSMPRYVGMASTDWWSSDGVPFKSYAGAYAYLNIDLWNSELDYGNSVYVSTSTRPYALTSISDDMVFNAVAADQQAHLDQISYDAGAQSLVDGTSPLVAEKFEDISALMDAGLSRTLDALNTNIAQLEALQQASALGAAADPSIALFNPAEMQEVSDHLTALTAHRVRLTSARTVLGDLKSLGATPSSAEFSTALAQARSILFPNGDGTEDVMARISSYALSADQLEGGMLNLPLHVQAFDPAAWRSAADFSGSSYSTPDLDPDGAFGRDPWAQALQDLQDQLTDLPDAADLFGRLSLPEASIALALERRSQQGLAQRAEDLHAAMLRTDLATTDIPNALRAPWVDFVNKLDQLTASSFAPNGVIDIDADLFDPVSGQNTRSLRDLLTAMQVDHEIDATSFMSTMGIVVDNRWASREGLNRLIEVMATELPEDVTVQPFAAPDRVTPQEDDGSALADVAAVMQYVQQSLRGLDDMSVFSMVQGVPDAVRITDKVLIDPDAPSERISLEALRLRVSMRWGVDPFSLMSDPGRTVITAHELNGWKALMHFSAQAMALDPNATADTAPWYDAVSTGGTALASAIDPALVKQAEQALAQISATDFAIGAMDINAPLMRDASGDRLSLRDLLQRLGVMDTLRERGVVMDHYITATAFNRLTGALGSLFDDFDVETVQDPLDGLSFNYSAAITVSGARAALYRAVRVIGSLEGSLSAFSTIDDVPYALATDAAVFDDPSSAGAKVSLDTLRARLLAATGFDLFASFSTNASDLGHGNRVVTAQELNGLIALAAMSFDTADSDVALKRVQNWSVQDIPDSDLRETGSNESFNRYLGVTEGFGSVVNDELAALFRIPPQAYDPSNIPDEYSVENFGGRITIADVQGLMLHTVELIDATGDGVDSYLDDPDYALNYAVWGWSFAVSQYDTLLSCDSSGVYSSEFVDALAASLLSEASAAEDFVNEVYFLDYGIDPDSQVLARVVDAGGFEAVFGGTVPSPFTLNHVYGIIEGVNAHLANTGWGNPVWVPSLENLQGYRSTWDTWGYNQETIDSIRDTVQANLDTMASTVAAWAPPTPSNLSNWAQALVDAGGRYATALDAGPGSAVPAEELSKLPDPTHEKVADLNALSNRFAAFAGLDGEQRADQWSDWRDATDEILDAMASDWDLSRSDLLDDVLPTAWDALLTEITEGETPQLTALRDARAEIDQARDGLNRQLLSLQARVTDDADALATALAAVQVRSATSPFENLLSDLMKGLQSLDDQFVDDLLPSTATLTGASGQALSLGEFLAELQAEAPDDVRAALADAGGLIALAEPEIDLANFSLSARDQWVSALVQALPTLADQLTITPVTGPEVSAMAERVAQQADTVRQGMDQMALWWEQVQAWAGQGLNTRTGLATNPAVDESELGYLYDTVASDYDATDPDTWYADRAGSSLWGRVRLAIEGLTREPDASGANGDQWRSDFYASIRQMVTVLGSARDRAGFVRTSSLDAFQETVQTLTTQEPFVDAITSVTQAWANGSDASKMSSSAWNSFRTRLQETLDELPLTPEALGLDTNLLDAVLDANAPAVTSTMTQNWLTGMNTRFDLVLNNLSNLSTSSATRLQALQCPAGVDAGVFAAAKGQEVLALQSVIDRFAKAATVRDQIGTDAFDLTDGKALARVIGDPEIADLLAYLWRMDVSPESLSQYRTDGVLRDENGDQIASYSGGYGGYFDFSAWQQAVIGARQSPYQDSQLTQGPTAFEELHGMLQARQQSLHDGLLQAQAQLAFSAADMGDALSRLQRVSAPTGYDGLWYRLALALQNISAADLGPDGVGLDVPLLPNPPGSATWISFNDLLAQLEAGMPDGATLLACFSGVPGFSLGDASEPVLGESARQDLLAAIYAALPSVATALSGYPVPGAPAMAMAMAMAFAAAASPTEVISARITEQRTQLLETPRVVAQPPATELELRQMLTEGADLYVDHSGAFYIQGIRTTARDVSITSRMLVQDKLSLEYKRLMDGMAERNNLIAAARDTLTTISNATGNDSTDRLSLYSALYAKQQLLGSDDLLSDLTAGQFTMDQLYRTRALQSNNGDLSVGHRPTLQDLSNYLVDVRSTIEATRSFYQERIDASNARANFYGRYGNTYTSQMATLYSRQQTWDGYVDDCSAALALADQLQEMIDDSADPVAFANALSDLEDSTGNDNLIGSLADFAMPSDIFSHGQLPPDSHADWAAGRLWGDDNTIRVWDGSQSLYREITVDWTHPTLGLTLNTPDSILVLNALGSYENSLWTVDAVKWKLGELDGPTQSFGLETYFYDVTGRTGLLDVYGDPARGHKYVVGLYQDEMWKQDSSIGSFGSTQRSTLSSLLNTLISNKIRDGDLDQAKLQALTGQLQNNIELMSALLKAFNELTTNLARAL